MLPVTYNLRSLLVRKTTSIATAIGIALVVFVFAIVQMLGAGIKRTLRQSGSPANAIALSLGADAELSSSFDDENARRLLAMPGVARSGSGEPLAVSELLVVASLEKLGASGVASVTIRGVEDDVYRFRPEAHIVEGRAATPGTDEVVIGRAIDGRFRGLALGSSFELRKNRPFKVVGIFAAGGSAFESEVWADRNAVRGAFGRDGSVSSVTVRLASSGSADKLDALKAAVAADRSLGVQVLRESAYYEKISSGTSVFITILGTIIAIFFSIGATIGAMITMYSSIANREREIGTLRALGFSRRGIMFSFLVESVLLSLAGGVVGALLALLMKFVKFSTMNLQTFSEVVFSFSVSTGILVSAFVFAAAMGLAGGFLPALRAASVSPIKALRA